jgi:GNAT superfamily N-acetyltransferase
MQCIPSRKHVQRWTIGTGGFLGEITLQGLADTDYYVRRSDEERSYVELTNYFVHPLRRHLGWGRELFETAIAHAEKRHWPVFLRAVPYGRSPADLERLVTFYRSYGFRQVRRGDKRELVLRW